MAEVIDHRAPQRAPLPLSYLLVWALLASLALGYLALLALRPDLAARFLVGPSEGSPEGNRGQRAMSRALAELGDIKKSVSQLEASVSELKSTLAAEALRGQTLEARIAAIEAAQNAGTPMARATPAGSRAEVAGAPDAANALGGTTVQGTVEERPAKTPRDGKTAPPTKAVAAAAGAAAAAKPAEPAKGPALGVWVASGPSLDAVRLSWQLLQESHKAPLKSLEPRFVESTGDPPAFQLIAGPVATREEAARICERLKAKQARCSVIPFSGQPL